MELNENIQAAINALGRKLDIEPAEIQKGIADIMGKEGVSDTKALSTWKNRNRSLFRSGNHDFLVFGKTEPRTINVTRRDGQREAVIANVNAIVQSNNGLNAYVISLWDDQANAVKDFEVGKKYSARLYLNSNGYASLVGNEVKTSQSKTLPDLDTAIQSIDTNSLDNIDQDNGKFVFYEGMIRRFIEIDDETVGLELESLTSLPVPFWCGDVGADLTEYNEDDRVLAFGKVAQSRKTGDYQIYGMALHKLKDAN